jgi:hypothetical protein
MDRTQREGCNKGLIAASCPISLHGISKHTTAPPAKHSQNSESHCPTIGIEQKRIHRLEFESVAGD